MDITLVPDPMGVMDGSVASSGYIGQVLSASTPLVGVSHSVSGSAQPIVSLLLSPGRWQVSGNFTAVGSGASSLVGVRSSISLTSGLIAPPSDRSTFGFSAARHREIGLPVPTVFYSSSVGFSVYLNLLVQFASGSALDYGTLVALRTS
jgi:hypothetical protein